MTPTGAAILKCFVTEVGSFPSASVQKVAYGAGTAEREIPNMLRVILFEEEEIKTIKKKLHLMECNMDDMNPELLPHVSEKILEAGALDVFSTSVAMKKGRQGILLSVLLEEHLEKRVSEILFRESSTLGIRKIKVDREELVRRETSFESSFGEVRVKESFLGEDMVKWKPEYDDMKRISDEKGIPLKELYGTVCLEYDDKLRSKN